MQKIGLVFSGGGGKGPYEVGVWRAMEQFGLAKDIIAVSGTSVGALNAALFAQGDLAKAEEAWLSMSPDDVLSLDVQRVIGLLLQAGCRPTPTIFTTLAAIAMYGVFSRKGLHRIIQNYLDEDTIKKRGMPCYACATRPKLPLFKAEYFSLQEYRQETIEDILLASSAIPGIFPPQKVQDNTYWDGFLTDNTPIRPLVDEGCNIIITVMLSRSELIDVDAYPNCKIIPIYPQNDPGGALNFNNNESKMQAGFDDTVKVLKPVFDLVETNYQYSVELLKYKKQHQEYQLTLMDKEQTDAALAISKQNLIEEMNKW